jgi:FAD/FMN-containing dehydrogenase
MGGRERERNESWFGTPIQSANGIIEKPVDEVAVREILRRSDRYPRPVRPVGSRHSMTECMSAQGSGTPGQWGTLVDMTGFTQLCNPQGRQTGETLRINDANPNAPTARVPVGRTFIDVAHELRDQGHGFAFRVNPEIGPLTIGAAACCPTKDSSFPHEVGQVCSDVVGMRVVLPSGEPQEFSTNDEEGRNALDALRCSYGLLGIITEVTFSIVPHRDISIRHEYCRLDEFPEKTSQWLAADNAVFLYMFPHDDRIIAELRTQLPARTRQPNEPHNQSTRLRLRNYFWERGLHDVAEAAGGVDALDSALEAFLKTLQIDRVSPVEQIVPFEHGDTEHRFAFSMWAFPAREFTQILPEYFRFCEDRRSTFRTGLPHVSYHIARDQSSLLSYSYSEDVWTLDPIAREKDAAEGNWQAFLRDFNARCHQWGGVPLLNQTPYLERAHFTDEYRARLRRFDTQRRQFDPGDRMLNDYFARLLAP